MEPIGFCLFMVRLMYRSGNKTNPVLRGTVIVSIVRKITLGYVILILIPVMVFGYYYYLQVYGNLTKQFVEGRQKILEQAYSNMRADLARIGSVQRLMQYNPYVTDYLNGTYETDASSIYTYNRYINPIITQSQFANPEMESILIYKTKEQVLPITGQVLDISALHAEGREAVRLLKPGHGVWMLHEAKEAAPPLAYYQNIYNPDFTEIIGLLELRVSSSLIQNFYKAAGGDGDWTALLLPEQGGEQSAEAAPEGMDKVAWRLLHSNDARPYFISRRIIVNQLHIEELGARVAIAGKVGDVFRTVRSKEIILVVIIIALLAALSIAYFMLASTIAKRILRLARHMRKLGDDNMKPFVSNRDRPSAQDEIEFLIGTYNSMIRRMDELINNVHRAELQKREAAYMVLQAQIKPHFLYNTLETIRMLAEANHDKEVADISYWFGRLMRYSLSAKEDRTILAKEIETAVFYLNIHKMRLSNRLTYELDIAADVDQMVCPRFILQPLVENSIIHGASAVLRPVHIKLQVWETEDEIRISVSDSGAGIPEDRLQLLRTRLLRGHEYPPGEAREGGVGLMNVSERIQSFFGGSSRLTVDSVQGQGTCLTILISKGAAGQR